MGVNLTPIIVKEVLNLKDLRGKRLAVDANNYLYQFLSLIRKRDGTPLQDQDGNITSHLVGLTFRSTKLIHDYGICHYPHFSSLELSTFNDFIHSYFRLRERRFFTCMFAPSVFSH